ncbi:hypothetical protein L6654_16820 [Bradyrhizobium sp. WYCCWR 13023]|uniref:Uncharacterized protein n=1 Tax=Bradyrhizobium zhengyangense TaxID=2911009 RepID=A0A9X1R9F1_9BRAD|nr:hypothetical protein [Bradyrhizobium zhengyangense]MCG2628296.1 hypothetical protein [Bradyrhizobium zhengyangense]
MAKYARTGTINATLVSYFLIGLLIAYVIGSARSFPTYNRSTATSPKSDDDPKNFQADMARNAFGYICGAIVFHWILIGYGRIFHSFGILSIKDTLNAAFALNAAFLPFSSLCNQIDRGAKSLLKRSGPAKVLGLAVDRLTTLSVSLVSFVYGAYAFAAIHQVPIISIVFAMIAVLVVFSALMIVFFRILLST